jgi:hypothetical protein
MAKIDNIGYAIALAGGIGLGLLLGSEFPGTYTTLAGAALALAALTGLAISHFKKS